MSFLKKIFGGKKPADMINSDQLPWIEAANNQWAIRLLDVRPITQKMTSTSSDPQMAMNAVSYGREDGTSFWGQQPVEDKEIRTNISFMTDGPLAPGELFKPRVMEHKWAIYFDGEHLIFVRFSLWENGSLRHFRQKFCSHISKAASLEFVAAYCRRQKSNGGDRKAGPKRDTPGLSGSRWPCPIALVDRG